MIPQAVQTAFLLQKGRKKDTPFGCPALAVFTKGWFRKNSGV
jgi:hypothetical protein